MVKRLFVTFWVIADTKCLIDVQLKMKSYHFRGTFFPKCCASMELPSLSTAVSFFQQQHYGL